MQGENIPKKNRLIDSRQNLPDDGRGALGNGRAFGRARKSKTAVNVAECLKVNFVSERKAGPSSTTVAQIARYPYGVYAVFRRCFDDSKKIGAASLRSIGPVMQLAPVAVRIEHIFKMDGGE